jgi:signal peptidase I
VRRSALGVLVLVLLLAGCTDSAGENAYSAEKRYQVLSGTMEPTIRAGEEVTADRIKPGDYQPRRGDVVVFTAPKSWASGPGRPAISRVIGIGGDAVACCDVHGRVLVNDEPLDEPYVLKDAPLAMRLDPAQCASRRFGPFGVPAGELFVMGDNRVIAQDSRCEGSVSVAAVIGLVRTVARR